MHSSPYGPVGVGLKGTLPNPFVVPEESSLVIGCRVFALRAPAPTASTASTGLIAWVESYNNTTPNNTVGASRFIATGALTDIDAIIQPKGGGGFSTHLATNTTVGGNKIGGGSTDTQFSRTAIDQVAGGVNSALIAGVGNRVQPSATYAGCFAGQGNDVNGAGNVTLGGSGLVVNGGTQSGSLAGQGNTNSGNGTVTLGGTAITIGAVGNSGAGGQNHSISSLASQSWAFGDTHTLTGLNTFAAGYFIKLDAPYASGSGYGAWNRGIARYQVFSSNTRAAQGDSQLGRFTSTLATGSATVTTFTTDGGVASATNQLVLPSDTATGWTGKVTARSATNFKTWIIQGGTANVAGVMGNGTTAPTATVITATAGAAAWAVTFGLDTTNFAQQFKATGAASTAINWTLYVEDCYSA